MTTHLRRYVLPGATVTERSFEVPLDHDEPDGERTSVFTIELVDPAKSHLDLPWLVFLQGGPGGPSPRPLHGGEAWFGRALRTHRVLLLDQRGTGRSAPVTWRQATATAPQSLARRLGLLRADSIVRDAELIRAELSPGRPWEVLGQSYGGWIITTYLSLAPDGLARAYIAGGVPGLTSTAYDLNLRTLDRVRDKVQRFYERFPQDRRIVGQLRDVLASGALRVPGGDVLTVDRVRQVGRLLGRTDGPARLHWLLRGAFDHDGQITDGFIRAAVEMTSFARDPLHMVLIDFTYPGTGPTRWPAARAIATRPEFDVDAEELLLTGEFSFPWMFREIARLRPFEPAMEILHARPDWTPTWDVEALRHNTVPVAGAIYHDDMYVDAGYSLETTRTIPNLAHWITNEWEHDGLARSGPQVLDRLMTMAADLPSEHPPTARGPRA